MKIEDCAPGVEVTVRPWTERESGIRLLEGRMSDIKGKKFRVKSVRPYGTRGGSADLNNGFGYPVEQLDLAATSDCPFKTGDLVRLKENAYDPSMDDCRWKVALRNKVVRVESVQAARCIVIKEDCSPLNHDHFELATPLACKVGDEVVPMSWHGSLSRLTISHIAGYCLQYVGVVDCVRDQHPGMPYIVLKNGGMWPREALRRAPKQSEQAPVIQSDAPTVKVTPAAQKSVGDWLLESGMRRAVEDLAPPLRPAAPKFDVAILDVPLAKLLHDDKIRRMDAAALNASEDGYQIALKPLKVEAPIDLRTDGDKIGDNNRAACASEMRQLEKRLVFLKKIK